MLITVTHFRLLEIALSRHGSYDIFSTVVCLSSFCRAAGGGVLPLMLNSTEEESNKESQEYCSLVFILSAERRMAEY